MERGPHGGQVDGVVDVVEGHGERLEGQHHALAALGAPQPPLTRAHRHPVSRAQLRLQWSHATYLTGHHCRFGAG